MHNAEYFHAEQPLQQGVHTVIEAHDIDKNIHMYIHLWIENMRPGNFYNMVHVMFSRTMK
jgi:hypothetical protein